MTKQIDIKELIPYLRYGYVAMDEDGSWCWYENEPDMRKDYWVCGNHSDDVCHLSNIKPVNDWTKSLIRINESQNNLCITDDTPHTESTVLFLDLLENKDE